MKILLCAVNAKYIHTNIAVRFIKGYCKSRGISDIDYKEFTINNMEEDIIREISFYDPDIISFSCYIWNISMIKRICSVLVKIKPEIKIVLGGPEVSYNPQEVLKSTVCNFIISGEGEKTSYELFTALENASDPSEVHGISYINKDGTAVSAECSSPLDMSELPFAYDDIDNLNNKIFYYEASRGCPFRCQYCLSSIEKGVRYAPLEKVKQELDIFLSKKVRQVKFVDRTFNANNSFAVSIMRYLIDNDNMVTNFHFEAEADLLTDEFLSVLGSARKGLFQLEIGVQSTNTDTLKAVSRTGSFEKLSERVKKILSFENTHVHLDLIAGLPLEDIASFRKSFNDVYKLAPHQLQLGFLKILHGSGMEKMVCDYNIRYLPYPPYEVLSTSCLSYKDISELKICEQMTDMYYNSNRFCFSLKNMLSYINDPYKMFMLLGKTVAENTSSNAAHNKNDLYKYIIQAADSTGLIDMNWFKWIVKFDYILHERPCGTPEWMKECINLLSNHEIYDILVHQNTACRFFDISDTAYVRKNIDKFYIEEMPLDPYTGQSGRVRIIINYTKRDLWGHAQSILINI